jgi:hypothetical protein
MNKISFKNPYDQQFDGFNEQAAALTTERTAQAAAKLFADKPYTAEHRKTYIITTGLKWAAAAISFVSALFAAYYVFSMLMGIYIAFALSFGACLLIELLKDSLWSTTAKSWLKYRAKAAGAMLVLVGLHLVSFGASVFGAFIAADFLPTEPQPKDSLINTAMLVQPYDQQITAIDQQTAVLLTEKPNAKTGKFSSTTKGIIESLATQKETLQKAKNELIEQTESRNKESSRTSAESAAKAERIHNEQMTFYKWSAAAFAAIFEVLFILCQCFIIRYLFRAYIDSKEATVTNPVTNNVNFESVTNPVTNEVTEPQQRTPIGFKMPEIVSKAAGVGSIGSCANCSKDFVKNSYTHKFCAETCRIEAWEKKNGKKLVRSN